VPDDSFKEFVPDRLGALWSCARGRCPPPFCFALDKDGASGKLTLIRKVAS
jgi:hypothetical protein